MCSQKKGYLTCTCYFMLSQNNISENHCKENNIIQNSYLPIMVADAIGKKAIKNLFSSLSFSLFKQASKQAKQKLFETTMSNFSKIISEMEILAHFSLCKQARK